MTIIYVVTSGSYSDYSIDGIFDNEKLANQFKKTLTGSRIEEHTLNPDNLYLDKINNGLKFYRVWLKSDGEVEYCYDDSMADEESYIYSNGECYVFTFARDEDHAIKIASDKRAQLLYEPTEES